MNFSYFFSTVLNLSRAISLSISIVREPLKMLLSPFEIKEPFFALIRLKIIGQIFGLLEVCS